MSMSQEQAACQCGQAHLIGMFVRKDYDEWALPIDVIAFRDCTQITNFLDDLPPDVRQTHFAEVMSTHLHHIQRWDKGRERRLALEDLRRKVRGDELDYADPDVLRQLRGEETD